MITDLAKVTKANPLGIRSHELEYFANLRHVGIVSIVISESMVIFCALTSVLSSVFTRMLQNIVLPYAVSLKLIPRFQCADGIHGVDQANTAGSIGWQCEAFDQDIVKIEFH
jgi:hypothetical protein